MLAPSVCSRWLLRAFGPDKESRHLRRSAWFPGSFVWADKTRWRGVTFDISTYHKAIIRKCSFRHVCCGHLYPYYKSDWLVQCKHLLHTQGAYNLYCYLYVYRTGLILISTNENFINMYVHMEKKSKNKIK